MRMQDIINYYKKWGNNTLTNQMAIDFTDMLLRKTIFALQTGNKIMAYGKMRTGKELEKMYCLAEDLFCDNPEYRGY